MAITHLYKFSNNSNDLVGGSNGTDSNVNYVNGYDQYSVNFNYALNSHIFFGAKNIPLGQKTISFIINNSKNDTYQLLLDECNNASGARGISMVILITSGILRTNLNKGTAGTTNFTLDTTISIANGKWNLVTFTWDGTTNSGAAKIYFNGVINNTATAAATETVSSTYNTGIGGLSSGTNGNYYLRDKLDNLIMDNIAWTAAKVKNEYSRIKGFF